MKVNEIFYSLQGEGAHTGRSAIFVRFSGCNLKCDFCDTQHNEGTEMTPDEIVKKLLALSSKCAVVVLTGGEPTLQVTKEFIDLLHANDFSVHIETNGTHNIPYGVDWVTLSPKYKKPIITRADELKVVYEGQDMDEWEKFNASYKYIQPCDRHDEEKNKENINKCVEFIKEHPQWILSLQTQKILNVQ